MSKPFDSATKRLVEAQPVAWLRYAGLSGEQAELKDADLSTITSEADRIIHVKTPEYLAHIELQASYEADIGERILRYNALACCRYRLPVQSVIVLLRREADGPALSGEIRYRVPDSDGELFLRYRVVRVWEKTVEDVLAGGLATLPMAPLADVSSEALPEIIRRMEERIEQEAPVEEVGMLWTATYLLMGLRYERQAIRQLLKGVQKMKESVTYQEILEEGQAIGEARGEARGKTAEACRLLLRLGNKRFGPPDAQTQAALEAITSLERLEQLAERLLEVENWAELMK